MKINILTFHYANNYGAVLQCYALSNALINKGHEVEIINLRPSKKRDSIKHRIADYLLSRQFVLFNNKYLPPQTKELNSLQEIEKYNFDADLFIVGSDQVWNLDITKEKYLVYFFDFLKKDQKRISYAASFGNSSWEWPDKTSSVKENLLKFNAVSIREEQGVKLAKNTFGIDSVQVLDPTLLLNAFDYEKLVSQSNFGYNKIVTYKFNKEGDWYLTLKKIKSLSNLDVLCINDNKIFKGLKFSYFTSVSKWLAAIKNSSLVITDSFHCMVFAIIFKKNFIAMPANPKRTSRMLSLLKQLGLENRYVVNYESLLTHNGLFETINYDVVHDKIQLGKVKSLDYLYSNTVFEELHES